VQGDPIETADGPASSCQTPSKVELPSTMTESINRPRISSRPRNAPALTPVSCLRHAVDGGTNVLLAAFADPRSQDSLKMQEVRFNTVARGSPKSGAPHF
jgi:hypothetical protein